MEFIGITFSCASKTFNHVYLIIFFSTPTIIPLIRQKRLMKGGIERRKIREGD